MPYLNPSYLNDRYQNVIICTRAEPWYLFLLGKIEHCVSQHSIIGPLFFLLYINNLPISISNKSKTVLFPDNTSVMVTNPNPRDFKNDMSTVLGNINLFISIKHNNILLFNLLATTFGH